MSNVFSRCVASLKDAEKALFGIVKDLSLMSLKSGLFMITHQDWLFLMNVWFESSILDTDLYVMLLILYLEETSILFHVKEKRQRYDNYSPVKIDESQRVENQTLKFCISIAP